MRERRKRKGGKREGGREVRRGERESEFKGKEEESAMQYMNSCISSH